MEGLEDGLAGGMINAWLVAVDGVAGGKQPNLQNPVEVFEACTSIAETERGHVSSVFIGDESFVAQLFVSRFPKLGVAIVEEIFPGEAELEVCRERGGWLSFLDGEKSQVMRGNSIAGRCQRCSVLCGVFCGTTLRSNITRVNPGSPIFRPPGPVKSVALVHLPLFSPQKAEKEGELDVGGAAVDGAQ